MAGQPIDPGVWITTLLNNVLNKVVWPLFFAASIIMFIYAGFMFLIAQGDPAKISQAKYAVVYAIIGIVITILGFSAVNIITSVLTPPAAPGTGGGAAGAACTQNTDCASNLCDMANQTCMAP